ncbi:hypothetical protein N0V90_011233 [Kalmusia sp. IMI 367209]|nr:hypothetical protein N0V90_011233 [Kalmusia sp. IMI 367209]
MPASCKDELHNTDGHKSAGPISNVNKAFYKQKYRFAAVDIEEDEPGPEVEARKTKLTQSGTIPLNFFWIKSICFNESFHAAALIVEDPGTIHDKALKGNALSHTLSLEELRRMFAHWKRQKVTRRQLKRERVESVTVVGDDTLLVNSNTAIGINGSNHNDEDLVMISAVDLGKERRKGRKPTQQDEIMSDERRPFGLIRGTPS